MTALEPLAMVVAIGPGGIIAREGTLPWKIPEDMAHFRRVTMGHAILMGRRTFESMGSRPLPGRRNLVLRSAAPTDKPRLEAVRGRGKASPPGENPGVVVDAAVYEACGSLASAIRAARAERSSSLLSQIVGDPFGDPHDWTGFSAIVPEAAPDPEPRIIGGARLYQEALPLVTKIYLTEVAPPATEETAHDDSESARTLTIFDLDRTGFVETERRAGETLGVTFITLERR